MLKFVHALAAIGALLAASGSVSMADAFKFQGTPPLVIKGYRFFSSTTGEYVGVRGVNYYPRPNTGALDRNNLDLFTSKFVPLFKGRDIAKFEALNANVIRLYAVDPDVDHRAFMCELQAKGIYVIVDLGSSCAGCEITPDSAPACYSKSYKDRGERIIRDFARYDNVMGFSGGNEVNHRSAKKNAESNAPCQKMFVRDMRNFIAAHKSKGMRQVPVGLVTADADRDLNALYYNCQSSSLKYERAEWYGLNTYIHCNEISNPKEATGFNNLRDDFIRYKYSIPVILTEFGCTSAGFPNGVKNGLEYKSQRSFHDALWMNSADYSEHFSGGCAFEYSTENANSKSTSAFPFTKFGPQNYGLGYFTPENCDDVTVPCSFVEMPNFDNLAAAYKQFDPSLHPTFSSFNPDPTRMAPTECPAGYPSIGGFTWAGGLDPINSFLANEVGRFQCPTTREGLDALLLSDEAGVVASSTTSPPITNRNASDGANYTRDGNVTKSWNSTRNSSMRTGTRRPTPVPSPSRTPLPVTPKPTSDMSAALDSDPAPGNSSGGNSAVAGVRSSRASASSSGMLLAALAVALALLQHG
ncbi:hypothetical protein PybrP1_000009 [[Pythium] brassicae (nom. inval.)]|nr:hypothetical protein PybrP1_000009 [[Pythium] brassicae (nom. inval.)]